MQYVHIPTVSLIIFSKICSDMENASQTKADAGQHCYVVREWLLFENTHSDRQVYVSVNAVKSSKPYKATSA